MFDKRSLPLKNPAKDKKESIAVGKSFGLFF
jgi:hypothetical protein